MPIFRNVVNIQLTKRYIYVNYYMNYYMSIIYIHNIALLSLEHLNL